LKPKWLIYFGGWTWSLWLASLHIFQTLFLLFYLHKRKTTPIEG
jgi:hypothetical protein